MNFGTLRRSLAGALAVTVFSTQCLFAYSPEKSFWESRRAASSQRPTLLNPLSKNLLGGRPINNGIAQEFSRNIPSSILRGRESLFAALRCPSVTLRGASAGAADRPTVVYIQDVHRNAEAQGNIAQAVGALLETGEIDLLALEGASAPIDLAPYREFPNRRAVETAADYLFRENQISGPVKAALTAAAAIPPVVGVEDPAHYRANVEAYRRSAPHIAAWKSRSAAERNRIDGKKAGVYSPALLALDRVVQDYRAGRAPLGELVDGLSAAAPAGPAVRAFKEVLAMERKMDFRAVERERAQLVDKLVAKLGPAEVESLTAYGLAYRSGQLNDTAFYSHLMDLCRRAGVGLDDVPAMQAYVRYVVSADRLNAEEFFLGLAALEAQAYGRLAATAGEKRLVAEFRQVYLMGKLVEFGLTPAEWAEYSARKNDGELASFENFYREAHFRDEAMARNLLRGLRETKAKTAVLVAGGFHAEGLAKALEHAGVSVITVAPRLEKADANGGSYLAVFAQEKTPLEKLFAPEKVYLAPDPAQGIGSRAGVTVAAVEPVMAGEAGPLPIEEIRQFLARAAGRPVDFAVQEIHKKSDAARVRVRFEGQTLEIRMDHRGAWTIAGLQAEAPSAALDRWMGFVSRLQRMLNLPAKRITHLLEAWPLFGLRTLSHRLWFLRFHEFGSLSEVLWRLAGLEGIRLAASGKRGLGALRAQMSVHGLFNAVSPVPLQARMTSAKADRFAEIVSGLEDTMNARVIGQGEAVKAVAQALQIAAAGMQESDKPIGAILLPGPTGVGKTEIAKALAAVLEELGFKFRRFDMTEFQIKETVSRLIGSPPGYRDSGAGGELTNFVKKNPFSILLIDEIEKAHPDIFQFFMGPMDSGGAADGMGNRVDMSNTIIIYTSNIGMEKIREQVQALAASLLEEKDPAAAQAILEEMNRLSENAAIEGLRAKYAPEIINRLDAVVPCHYLSVDAMLQVARLQMNAALSGIPFSMSDEAYRRLLVLGYSPTDGVRPLKRAIAKHIKLPIAQATLANGRRTPSHADISLGPDGAFAFNLTWPAAEPPRGPDGALARNPRPKSPSAAVLPAVAAPPAAPASNGGMVAEPRAPALPLNYLLQEARWRGDGRMGPGEPARGVFLVLEQSFDALDAAGRKLLLERRFRNYEAAQTALTAVDSVEFQRVVFVITTIVLTIMSFIRPISLFWGFAVPAAPVLLGLFVFIFWHRLPRIWLERSYKQEISEDMEEGLYIQDPSRGEAECHLDSVFSNVQYALKFEPKAADQSGTAQTFESHYGSPEGPLFVGVRPPSSEGKGTLTLVYDPALIGGVELMAGALDLLRGHMTAGQRLDLGIRLRLLRQTEKRWRKNLARVEGRHMLADILGVDPKTITFSGRFSRSVKFDWDPKAATPAARLRKLTLGRRLNDPVQILTAVSRAMKTQVLPSVPTAELEEYNQDYMVPLLDRRNLLSNLLNQDKPRRGRILASLAGAALVCAWLVVGDTPSAIDLAGLPVLAMFTDRLEDLATRIQSVLGWRSSPRAPPAPVSEPASGKPLSPEKISLELFTRHTDGLSMASTISQLNRPVSATGRSVFDVLAGRVEPISIARLIAETGLPANADGHLHAAFYYLEKQGWLRRAGPDGNNKMTVVLTAEGREFVKAAVAYDVAAEFISATVTGKDEMEPLTFRRWRERLLSDGPVGAQFSKLLELAARGWDIPDGVDPAAAAMVRKHLDGVIVSTLMIGLQYDGEKETTFWNRLRDGNASLSELAALSLGWPEARLAPALEFLAGERLGFAAKTGAGWGLTEAGKMAAKRVWGFGVPFSYFPTYGRMDLLLGGQPLMPGTINGTELHVWRDVNAKGSGGSHIVYFDNMTEQSIQAFNNPDIDQQPLGILDIGCGDGESLRTQIRRILNETERGRMIKKFPNNPRYALRVVGVDLFPESRQITTDNLRKDGWPTVLMGEAGAKEFKDNVAKGVVAAVVMKGDVSNPAEFSKQLRDLGMDPHKLVWTSTMLIHDRKLQLGNWFSRPINRLIARWRWAHAGVSLDDGAFIDEDTGRPVTNLEVLDDLYRHFKNYSEYVRRFGYYFVDLHYPAMAVPGRTFFSYMVNHSHAGQYTVPIRYYQLVADQLGLTLDIFKAIPGNVEMATVGIYRLYEKEAANDPDGGLPWKEAAVWLLTAITALVAFVLPATPAKLAGEDLRSFGVAAALPPVRGLGVESLDGRVLGRIGRRFAKNPLYAHEWARQVDTLAHAHVVLSEDLRLLEEQIAQMPEDAERPLAIVLIPGANDPNLIARLQALAANPRVSVLMPHFDARAAWLSVEDVSGWAEGKGRVAWMATRNPKALPIVADPRGAPGTLPPIFAALIEILKTAPPISRVDFDLFRRVTTAILRAA